MKCPDCAFDFLALFHCHDGVYRCGPCRHKLPAPVKPPTPTDWKKAERIAPPQDSKTPLCRRCKAQPVQVFARYGPGVHCSACAEHFAAKAREYRAKLSGRNAA